MVEVLAYARAMLSVGAPRSKVTGVLRSDMLSCLVLLFIITIVTLHALAIP